MKARIKKVQLGWFSHVQRKERNRLPRKLYEAITAGRRPRDLRRVTWEDNVRFFLKGWKCSGMNPRPWPCRDNGGETFAQHLHIVVEEEIGIRRRFFLRICFCKISVTKN